MTLTNSIKNCKLQDTRKLVHEETISKTKRYLQVTNSNEEKLLIFNTKQPHKRRTIKKIDQVN